MTHVPVDVEEFLTTAEAGLAATRGGRNAEAKPLLLAAEARYTGDFLEEDAYDDWVAPLRDEARTVYVSVTRRLAELADQAGDHDGSARLFLRLLEKDGWDEAAHIGLVATLASAGRHGEARHRYQQYAARMAELQVPTKPYASLRPAG